MPQDDTRTADPADFNAVLSEARYAASRIAAARPTWSPQEAALAVVDAYFAVRERFNEAVARSAPSP